MKSTRTLLSALSAALLLGLVAGLAVAGPSAGADPTTSTDSTTIPTTATEPSTTDPTSSTTTTPPTTTTESSTTAPTTTDTTPTTTNSTTVGSTTTSTTAQAPVEQSTTQSNTTTTTPSTTTTPGTTTAPPPPPTAPCDTTAITCGNNAATQLAIVSQTCNANSANTLINVNVTTLDGHPVNNVTIQPQTSCLNELHITQIVQQYCMGCTVIVIPPPPAPPPYVPAAPGPPAVQRMMGYCTSNGLAYLEEGQPAWDPNYASAFPATYVPGLGMSCPGGAPPTVPTFTLTVPASFIGQYVNLCIQPPDPRMAPHCHSVRIDAGATISVPVTANVKATVTPVKLAPSAKPRSPKAIAKASKAIASALAAKSAHPKHKAKHTKNAAKHTAKNTTKKGARR